MNKLTNTKSGFTLVEVLTSVLILLNFLLFVPGMFITTQSLASYSKHKIQAAYLAQLIIEKERQLPFAQIVSQAATKYPLDTKGNFNSNLNYFYGTVVITVTPASYTTLGGAQVPNNNVAHLVVVISWPEQMANLPITMTETYAEDIANAPMLN